MTLQDGEQIAFKVIREIRADLECTRFSVDVGNRLIVQRIFRKVGSVEVELGKEVSVAPARRNVTSDLCD